MLDDASRVLAIACMLIASRTDGKVPADPAYIKRVAYLSSVDFEPLLSVGFLKVSPEMLANASTLQAKATTEERRVETEDSSVSHEKIVFDGSSFKNINGHLDIWMKAYPAINVEAEIAKAAAWIVANPKNTKKQWGRFLNGWLSRAQDKAPRVASGDSKFAGGI